MIFSGRSSQGLKAKQRNQTKLRTPIDMDRALHTDFTKSETSGGIKTIISPFVYL